MPRETNYNNPILFKSGDIISVCGKKMTIVGLGKTTVKVFLWAEGKLLTLAMEVFKISRPYKIIYKYKGE